MKPIFGKLLTILGFKRKKPTTKLGRIARCCEHALTVAVFLYILVLVFPHPLFAHTHEHAGIKLYSREPVPAKEADALLSQIRSRISGSEIYQKEQTFRIFLCNSQSLYTLFSPVSRESFGHTPISGNIMLAHGNLGSGTATAFRSDHNKRTFVGVASHEICHVMIRRAFGWWAAFRAPTWLDEGYCEHISGESSFPEEEGDNLFSKDQQAEGKAFEYFVYRRMMDFCLMEQNRNITELFSDPPSEQHIRNQTQEWVSRTSNNPMQATPYGAPDG